MEDNRTLLIEDTYRYLNINSAVYIDIFPMDGAPSSFHARRFHLYHINVWQHLLAMYYADPNKGRSLWKRPIVALVKRLLSQQSINRHIRKLMMKYDYDSSDIVGYYEGRMNELIPKSVIGNPKPFLFEEREFWGVAEPDQYLTSLYGDYMQLPPEDQRQAHFHSVVKWL